MWREYTDALALDLPHFRTRRARAGQTLDTIVLLGSRQVVRQRTLDPPLEGSNPSSPANLRPVHFLIGTLICLIGRGPRSINREKADPSPSDRRQSHTVLTLILGAPNVAPMCAARTDGADPVRKGRRQILLTRTGGRATRASPSSSARLSWTRRRRDQPATAVADKDSRARVVVDVRY
jgi:hypothetical protein